jgi:hypothetical protein
VGGVDKHFLSHCVLFQAPFGGILHNNPGGAALSEACSIMARRATADRAANWPPALSLVNVARSIALVSDHQLGGPFKAPAIKEVRHRRELFI